MQDGRIVDVGKGPGEAPEGATIIDANAKTVTPGLIDTHSHLGVYPTPHVKAHADGNEMTAPTTPDVRAIDGFWTQDPGLRRAVAGGVTTIQVLPGSGNLVGGRGVTMKLRPATLAQDMKMYGAPSGLKMACGENPKRVYGKRKIKPMSRMGNLAVQRAAFFRAKRLIAEWDAWRAKETERQREHARARAEYNAKKAYREQTRSLCRARRLPRYRCAARETQFSQQALREPEPLTPNLPPARDIGLETLAAAIEGRILVHIHCYRSDDMGNMMELADEMGFAIRSFHHGLEAYKIRKVLAERKISVSTWADWWGFKMEAYDGIPQNLALLSMAGVRAIVHSDSREGIRRLNQEAAKGMFAGRRMGLEISEGEAMRWITGNPAWALGIDDRVGTLTKGKHADLVIWSGDPFSVYSKAEQVFVEGEKIYDASRPGPAWSDFEAAP
jgi:imidazolonepropionase-like amidohydrolase